MKKFTDKSLSERREEAARARQAMIEKMRAMPGPDDPAVKARIEAQIAVAKAREERAAERQAAKERAEREVAEREAARLAEIEAQKQREAEEAAARQAALEAEQKAARDARYAARKKRKK